jgi:Protein of unknown function (DUF1194)
MAQLARAPFHANRHIIDVSGDGIQNSGRAVTDARDEALAKGVTINGLVSLSEQTIPNAFHTNPPGGLDAYYRNNVIGGPGAFVMVAENFSSFGETILNKLNAEIAPKGTKAQVPSPRVPRRSPGYSDWVSSDDYQKLFDVMVQQGQVPTRMTIATPRYFTVPAAPYRYSSDPE